MAAPVFISYQRQDAEHARLLAERLTAYGGDVWWDKAIQPGEDWRESIIAGLERAQIFVLLYSSAAEQSNEVKKELAVASAGAKTLIAVRLENRQPSGPFRYEMAAINWVEAWQDSDAVLDRLAQRLAQIEPGSSNSQIAAAVDAKPIRRSVWARLTTSPAWLALIALAALCIALAAQSAAGEGLDAARTELGFNLGDVVNAVVAMAFGAPLVVLRFLMEPPRTAWHGVLLLAVVLLLATYVLMARCALLGWQRRRAQRRAGGG